MLPLFLVQNIIAEHEIRNISCAAQDPEDLCTFAYITKDLQTSHHYCHVFSTVDVVRIPFCPLPRVQLRKHSFIRLRATWHERLCLLVFNINKVKVQGGCVMLNFFSYWIIWIPPTCTEEMWQSILLSLDCPISSRCHASAGADCLLVDTVRLCLW